MTKRNPIAVSLKHYRQQVVKAKKGKGSYKRKPKYQKDKR